MIIKQKILFITLISLFGILSVSAQNAGRDQGLLTLEPEWRQALGGTVLSLPDVQAQSAVVALDGGNIKAYSTKGTPLWNYSARGRISSYVARSREGTSYLSRTNGLFMAVNRAGREVWRYNLGSPLCAKPVTGWDSRIFVPVEKKLFCFTSSGYVLWTKNFDSAFSTAPKLDRYGGIIFSLENNEVHNIDQFGNPKVWTLLKKPAILLSLDNHRIMVLYPDGNMDILGGGDEWFLSVQGNTQSSQLAKLPNEPMAAAVGTTVSGNYFAAALFDGTVILYSVEDKKIVWRGDSHIREYVRSKGNADTETEIIFDERGIIVLSKNGATCFSHEGARLWYMFLNNTSAVPSFGDDGMLYSGGRDWILYAYKIDNVLMEKNNIYGKVPDGSYETGIPNQLYAKEFPNNEYELTTLLGRISSGINSGKVGSNELAWTSLLMMISTSEFHISYRLNALSMLGKIGSQETISWLVNFFREEPDLLMKAQAVNSIGAIGVDPNMNAISAFLYFVSNSSNIKDEKILYAIAAATGALCRFSGPPLSETGVKILTLLSAANRPPIVRNQAKKEIASLK